METANVQTFEIAKNKVIDSTQNNVYKDLNIGGKLVANPTFSKTDLILSYKNSTNRRCINAKAAVIAGLGYSFKDEENAKNSGVVDFLNGIYAKDGSPKPFSQLLKEFYADFLTFGWSRLECLRVGKQIEDLLLLSANNLYITPDRKTYWQYDKLRNKTVQFKPYQKQSSGANDTIGLTSQSPEDDYYGVPCYVSAIPVIKESATIVNANIESIEEIIDPSMILMVTGHTLPNADIEKIATTFRNVKEKRSSFGLVNIGSKDAVVDLQNYGSKQVDGNYLQEKNSISLEIMSLHGLTPELYGMLTTGGISSGEKATGALKIFLQTEVRPAQEVLQKMVNGFLIKEFPSYAKDNEFILNSIDLTDSNEDATTELTKAQTIQAYATIGSMQLYNEYRESQGQELINEKEWLDMIAGASGLGFNSAKVPQF